MKLSDIYVTKEVSPLGTILTLYPCNYCHIEKAQLNWWMIEVDYSQSKRKMTIAYVCSPECVNGYILSVNLE